MSEKEIFNWNWWKKRLLMPEVILFIIVLCLAFYLYWKYDRHVIRLNNDIDYDSLFLQPLRPIHGGALTQKRPKRINKTENKCRVIFEKIFSRPFPSIRPEWLKNPTTGKNLELDGYCEELQLAFEYDGVQHARFDKHFHKSGTDFVYQVAKDDYKTKKCKIEGIDLIRIPHYISPISLEDYIRREIKRIPRLEKFAL